jgi:hypothetical protein
MWAAMKFIDEGELRDNVVQVKGDRFRSKIECLKAMP